MSPLLKTMSAVKHYQPLPAKLEQLAINKAHHLDLANRLSEELRATVPKQELKDGLERLNRSNLIAKPGQNWGPKKGEEDDRLKQMAADCARPAASVDE